MAGTKKRETKLRWGDVLRRQSSSGLSIRQFCTKEGIWQASFYAWRTKLREPQDGKSRPQRLNRGADEPGKVQKFISLAVHESSSTLEVVHPLGYRVRVGGEVDSDELQRVLIRSVISGRVNIVSPVRVERFAPG